MVDLADLHEDKLPPVYTVETKALGQLGFRRLYTEDRHHVGRWHALDTADVTRNLLALHGFRTADRSKIADDALVQVEPVELVAFAQAFQSANAKVFEGLEQELGEGDVAFVARGVRTYLAKNKGALDLPDVVDPYFADVPLDSKLRNRRATDFLREALAAARPEPPSIPRSLVFENPIVRTNALLENMGREITRMGDISDRTAAMQASLNDQASEAIDKMEEGAKATDASANKALRVGMIGVWIAVASLIASLASTVGIALWDHVEDAKDKAEEVRERQADRALMRQQLEATRRYEAAMQARVERLEAPARKDH